MLLFIQGYFGGKKMFKLGQSSLEVCQAIVGHNPTIQCVMLILHKVGINWRQSNLTTEQKAQDFINGFYHIEPSGYQKYLRKDFLDLKLDDLKSREPNEVWSISSRVWCDDNRTRQIVMMNFHPKGIGLDEIREALKIICGNVRGVILNSGRYQHYYGNLLLNEDEWVGWMAEFLGPCILVSPRYIGHRLHYGYSTLRLTRDTTYKPKIPEVIEIL
ncbi:hypothetical protein ACFL29_00560 [Patescibacteria group bacterium]